MGTDTPGVIAFCINLIKDLFLYNFKTQSCKASETQTDLQKIFERGYLISAVFCTCVCPLKYAVVHSIQRPVV